MKRKVTLLACILLTISIFTGCNQQSKSNEVSKKQTTSLTTTNIDKQKVTDEQQKQTLQSNQETTTQTNTQTTNEIPKNGKENLDLAVIKQDIGKDETNNPAIICTVQNNRDYPLKNVIAEITYYNADVKVLGTSSVKVDVVEAKGTWKFVTTIPSEYQKDFKAYRVSKLAGEK